MLLLNTEMDDVWTLESDVCEEEHALSQSVVFKVAEFKQVGGGGDEGVKRGRLMG